MSNQDDDYLSKDFDVTKLTIPKIKKILVENGITEFPPRVKKDQLIEIFKENIEAIRKKKKKESNRKKNIYQEERSSIIELEANENDQKGGIFTSGRKKNSEEVDKKPEKVELKGEVSGYKGNKNRQEANQDVKQELEQESKQQSPEKRQNVSFLESLGAHLRGTSNRRQMNQKEPTKSGLQTNSDLPTNSTSFVNSPVKKVVVDVDSNISDTSFFSSRISRDSSPHKGNMPSHIESMPLNTHKGNMLSTSSWSKSFWYSLLVPLILVVVSLCVYKSLPYCSNGDLFCLSVPKNGRLINGQIVCDNGFVHKKTFFREMCSKDETKETRMLRKINLIVRQLEILRGDYRYRLTRNYKMNLSQLTSDNELIEILKHTPRVVVSGDEIYAIKHRITLRSFARHYSTKALYFLICLCIFLVLFHFVHQQRIAAYERKASSQKIVKEILNILLRQLVISSKNSRFPGFVFVDHLKDVFLVEKKVWELVRKSVEANSNVKRGEMDNKETWEWVGPFIQNTESIESLVL